MNDKAFLDTNVLVYSFDPSEAGRQEQANRLVGQALDEGSGVISTQVVQEFLNLATRKFAAAFTAGDLLAYLDTVLMPLCGVFPDASLYRSALEVREETGFSFYDCLIVAGAVQAGCSRLLSEDMQDGRMIRGVRIENPFRAS
jgi:predicted nucleic acid-binding protein